MSHPGGAKLLVLQTHKNKGLYGKETNMSMTAFEKKYYGKRVNAHLTVIFSPFLTIFLNSQAMFKLMSARAFILNFSCERELTLPLLPDLSHINFALIPHYRCHDCDCLSEKLWS